MPKVLAFVPDLMDRSRFPSSADVTFVRSVEEIANLAATADVIVVDLNRNGAFEAVAALRDVKRIGFTNHENTELIQQANAAGVHAMARSRFFARVAEIVSD